MRPRSRQSPGTAGRRRWTGVLVAAGVLLGSLTGGTVAANAATASTPTTVTGYDVSWPQCGRVSSLPKRPAFAIVGVNDGIEGTRNPCLSSEVAWARTATGRGSLQKVSYYVEAADPHTETRFERLRWPTSDHVAGHAVHLPARYRSPSGAGCSGANTAACAYVYGWATARRDFTLSGLGDPAKHVWWLDVEDAGVWSASKHRNQAILDGMAAYFRAHSATVGIYSTASLWKRIVGHIATSSPLHDALDWEPAGAIGGGSKPLAVTRLEKQRPFSPGGRVAVVQWTAGGIDHNLALR